VLCVGDELNAVETTAKRKKDGNDTVRQSFDAPPHRAAPRGNFRLSQHRLCNPARLKLCADAFLESGVRRYGSCRSVSITEDSGHSIGNTTRRLHVCD